VRQGSSCFADQISGGEQRQDGENGCPEAVLKDSCFRPFVRYLIERADIDLENLGAHLFGTFNFAGTNPPHFRRQPQCLS